MEKRGWGDGRREDRRGEESLVVSVGVVVWR